MKSPHKVSFGHERPCAICGTRLNPFQSTTLTAHEFECYKSVVLQGRGHKIPFEHQKQYLDNLVWERRSKAAKKTWADRRRRRK